MSDRQLQPPTGEPGEQLGRTVPVVRGGLGVDLPQRAAVVLQGAQQRGAFGAGADDEHDLDTVLHGRPPYLLGGGEHGQALGPGRLVGDHADGPDTAPGVAQERGGHALRGRRRAHHQGRAGPSDERPAPVPVHRAPAEAGRRRVQGAAEGQLVGGERVVGGVCGDPGTQHAPAEHDPPPHGGQFVEHGGHGRGPVEARPGVEHGHGQGQDGDHQRPPGRRVVGEGQHREQGRAAVRRQQRQSRGRPGDGPPPGREDRAADGVARRGHRDGRAAELALLSTGGVDGAFRTFRSHVWMDSLHSVALPRRPSAPPSSSRYTSATALFVCRTSCVVST